MNHYGILSLGQHALSICLFFFPLLGFSSDVLLELDAITSGCLEYPKTKLAKVMSVNHCNGVYILKLVRKTCKQHC